MRARSLQISMEEGLIALVDRHPIAREKGRSAFIRQAIEAFLEAERRRTRDEAYARGYSERAATRLDRELGPLLEGQAWPEE